MCETLQALQDELKEIESECPGTGSKTAIYEDTRPNLYNLPVEIIIHICKYLDAEFIRFTLSKVCERFDFIFNDTSLWKMWLRAKVKNTFPALPNLEVWEDNEIDWERAGIEICKEEKKWDNIDTTTRHVVVNNVHFASVDTILLVNNGRICISGGRDRGMALWKVLEIAPHNQSDNITNMNGSKPEHLRLNAHSGWVWDLAADDVDNAKMIYSASWDNSVKSWDLEAGFTEVEQFPCGMSALSLIYQDHTLMAGLYNKKIVTFDVRAGKTPVRSYKAHKGPVLALESYNNVVASVSEDKTLAVYDRVAGKLVANEIAMPTAQAYPVCISWSPSALYVGDSKGRLHLIDPEKYKYLKSHVIWPVPEDHLPASKITSCIQSVGYMIASSDKGEIKFFYNCYPPVQFESVRATSMNVTQVRYQNGTLAIGTCDSAIEFWVPLDMYEQ